MSRRVLRRISSGVLPSEILRPEITRIRETGRGLWVTSERPRRALFISRAIDGYADVREAVSAWKTIEPIRGPASFFMYWKDVMRHGPRDAVAGTALANDLTLREELARVREASRDRGVVEVGARYPNRRWTLALWVALVAMFLGIWQFLSPAPSHPRPAPRVFTADECRASGQCVMYGKCGVADGVCVAVTDTDCMGSKMCEDQGLCKHAGRACIRGEEP